MAVYCTFEQYTYSPMARENTLPTHVISDHIPTLGHGVIYIRALHS